VGTWATFFDRAAVGPLPGWTVVIGGALFHGSWIVVAVITYIVDRRQRLGRSVSM
jgi:uncharacterized membrane protein